MAEKCMKFRISISLSGLISMMLFFLITRFLGIFFYLANAAVNSRVNNRATSAFECGIERRETIYSSYSFYCYYYLILFVLFDVELCCLLPIIERNINFWFILILTIFLASTLVELYDGVLNWVLNVYQVE